MAKLPILYIKRGGGAPKENKQKKLLSMKTVWKFWAVMVPIPGYLLGPVVVQLLQTVCEMALTSLTHQPPGGLWGEIYHRYQIIKQKTTQSRT